MIEVTLMIKQRNNIRFVAYLVGTASTDDAQTIHGSANGNTYKKVLNAGYRLAHQKSLKIVSVFDEDKNQHFPVHRYRVGDRVRLSTHKHSETIEELRIQSKILFEQRYIFQDESYLKLKTPPLEAILAGVFSC